MPETSEEKHQRKLRELEGKNIAYYSTMLSTWIDNKMEYDKTLITLSSMAIGLIVTLLTTTGINAMYEFIIFLFAFISFTITILTALIIFHLNSKIIEDSLKETSEKNYNIKKYDILIISSFTLGMILTMAFASSHAFHTYTKKNIEEVQKKILSEKNVTINNQNNKKVNSMSSENNDSTEETNFTVLNDSVEGINTFDPENHHNNNVERSINGINQLNPETNTSDNSNTDTTQSNNNDSSES